jgi:hypothetical protein
MCNNVKTAQIGDGTELGLIKEYYGLVGSNFGLSGL